MRPEQVDRFTGWSRALGTRNALPTPSHKWLRRSPSAGYLSIRTLDPLAVTQGFIVAAKSLIKNGKLVGEVAPRLPNLAPKPGFLCS
jgi:hypothetical protein